MRSFVITMLLLVINSGQVQGSEIICIQIEKSKATFNKVDLDSIKKLEFDKIIPPAKIRHRDGFDIVILEKTNIPANELLTKKGIKKLIPALASTYICMSLPRIYSGQEDKILHHTFTYVAGRITNRPIVTVTGFSLVKELGYDMLLGLGTPDWQDVAANIAGVVHSKAVKNNPPIFESAESKNIK